MIIIIIFVIFGACDTYLFIFIIICCCHHEDFIGACSFYGEHALAYTQPQFLDMSGPETKSSHGRPKETWKTQVEKENKSVGLEKKDAMNRARWRVGVREIAAGVNPATPVYGNKPGSKLD